MTSSTHELLAVRPKAFTALGGAGSKISAPRVIGSVMHLSDEQLVVIISWAKRTPDVEPVFLHGRRANGTAVPDSDVDLALSMTGVDPLRRLTTFISYRRG